MAKATEAVSARPTKYVVTLPPGGPVTIEASSPEDAKAKFNELCGIVSTTNDYSIEPVSE